MPRNASGVYTLPPTNPVVPFTTIATAWANPTLADIAAAITNSLDRTGLGGMLAPFRIADGTLATPGLGFTNELSLGIYRPSLGVMAFVAGGLEAFQVTTGGLISLTRLEHRGIDVYKVLGSISWRVSNDVGVWTVVPSASVDGEDWDLPKAIRLTGAGNLQIPGSVEISGDLDVLGTFFAALLQATSIEVTNLSAFKILTNKLAQIPVILSGLGGSYTADFEVAQSHVASLASPVTITPTNIPIGSIMRVTLSNTVAGAIAFAGVVWPLGIAPNFTAGPLKKAVVVITNEGTSLLGSSSVY